GSRSSGCCRARTAAPAQSRSSSSTMKHALVRAVGAAQQASNESDVHDLSSRSSGCCRARTAAPAQSRSSSSTMKHALVRAVGAAQQASNESDVQDLSSLLFEQAQILDGE